jgi:CheY-like chemotaxis protein
LNSQTIAIVEDDATLAAAMTEIVADEGYRTEAWAKAAGAHEGIRALAPRLVILDIHLEDRNAGLALLDRLRSDPTTAATPVIVCTSDHRFVAEWKPVLEQRDCRVLARPFPVEELLAQIGQMAGEPPIPAAVEPPVALIAPPAEPDVMVKQRIALIDDDGRGVSLLADGVEAKGYEALPWRWGNGLTDMLARERPDLVLIDVNAEAHRALWHVLQRLRRDPATREMPAILLTENETRFPAHGGRYQVLRKPIVRPLVYSVVEALVGPPPKPPTPPRRKRKGA